MTDFLVYHNGPKLGSDYELRGKVEVGFRSKRRSVIEHALHNKVWVVSRKVGDGSICLDGAYIAEKISDDEDKDYSFLCWGEVSVVFDPPVRLANFPWYRDLLRATANFVGFQKLSDETAARFAEIERDRPPEPRQAGDPELEQRLLAEGLVMRRFVKVRSRSDTVRAICLDHYGAKCKVCDVDFGSTYGPEFDGLIDVHHLNPLAQPQSGEPQQVDPVRDCVPLCPNCHRMAHYGLPPSQTRSLEELRVRVGQKQSSIE